MHLHTKEIADSIAQEIAQVINIKEAYVDDYKIHDNYIDFQVVALLKVHKGGGSITSFWPDSNYESFNLRKTSNDIRKILKNSTKVMKFGKAIDCPSRVYRWNGVKNEFDGYDRYYIMVDFMLAI